MKAQTQRIPGLGQSQWEGAVGWQGGLDLQKQRSKTEPRSLGTRKLRPVGGEGWEALDGSSAPRFGNPAFQPWLHCVWGKPQKPRVALGFPSVLGTILSPPQPASFCGWGLWGRAGGGDELLVALWPRRYTQGEGRRSCRLLPPSSILGQYRGHGGMAAWRVLDGALSLAPLPRRF